MTTCEIIINIHYANNAELSPILRYFDNLSKIRIIQCGNIALLDGIFGQASCFFDTDNFNPAREPDSRI